MVDNVAITAGAGTSVATDDIGGVHFQRVKLALGADGAGVDAVAGAGAVSTAVQRVTLASDDPAVAALALTHKQLYTEQDGTPKQISFADHAGDFGPTAANVIEVGTPTDVQLTMATVANNAARQSTKFDFGANRAKRYTVRAAIEFAATPTAGNVVEIFLAPSGNATAGTGNAANCTGADAAYAGYSSNIEASVRQLQLIGVFVCTAQATATIQVAECGEFTPTQRYGSIVVSNKSGAAIHTDDQEFNVVLDPIVDEVQ